MKKFFSVVFLFVLTLSLGIVGVRADEPANPKFSDIDFDRAVIVDLYYNESVDEFFINLLDYQDIILDHGMDLDEVRITSNSLGYMLEDLFNKTLDLYDHLVILNNWAVESETISLLGSALYLVSYFNNNNLLEFNQFDKYFQFLASTNLWEFSSPTFKLTELNSFELAINNLLLNNAYSDGYNAGYSDGFQVDGSYIGGYDISNAVLFELEYFENVGFAIDLTDFEEFIYSGNLINNAFHNSVNYVFEDMNGSNSYNFIVINKWGVEYDDLDLVSDAYYLIWDFYEQTYYQFSEDFIPLGPLTLGFEEQDYYIDGNNSDKLLSYFAELENSYLEGYDDGSAAGSVVEGSFIGGYDPSNVITLLWSDSDLLGEDPGFHLVAELNMDLATLTDLANFTLSASVDDYLIAYNSVNAIYPGYNQAFAYYIFIKDLEEVHCYLKNLSLGAIIAFDDLVDVITDDLLIDYSEGFTYGYETGYNAGYNHGNSAGYAEGYFDGINSGSTLQYSITFMVDEETYDFLDVGEELILPPIPQQEGHIFLGWYYDEDFNTKFKISDELTENIILYGRFSTAGGGGGENVPPSDNTTWTKARQVILYSALIIASIWLIIVLIPQPKKRKR